LIGRRQLSGVANWTTEHSRQDEYDKLEWAHGPLHRSRQNAYLNWLQHEAEEQYLQIFASQLDPDDTTISAEQYKAIGELPEDLSFNHWVGQSISDLISRQAKDETNGQPFLAVAAFCVDTTLGVAPEQRGDQEALNITSAAAGIKGDGSPKTVAAGDGSESAFQRLKTGQFQSITVAEPLNLQGWQLVDELTRAITGDACSGYVTAPAVVTMDGARAMGDSPIFDPENGYREAYTAIWGK